MVIFEKKSLLLRNAGKKVCFAGNLLAPPSPYQMSAPLDSDQLIIRGGIGFLLVDEIIFSQQNWREIIFFS